MSEIPASIELVKEWSIWLVGIQTSALGFLSFTVQKQDSLPFNKKFLRPAIIAFVLSILTASWTLSALPEIVARMPNSDANIHDMRMFRLLPVPLWVFTAAQHWFFIIGLVFFSYGVIKKIGQELKRNT